MPIRSVPLVLVVCAAALIAQEVSPPVQLTAEQDHQRIMDLLHITSLPPPAGLRRTRRRSPGR